MGMSDLEEAARKSIEIIDNENRHPQTDAEIRVLMLLVLALDGHNPQGDND